MLIDFFYKYVLPKHIRKKMWNKELRMLWDRYNMDDGIYDSAFRKWTDDLLLDARKYWRI